MNFFFEKLIIPIWLSSWEKSANPPASGRWDICNVLLFRIWEKKWNRYAAKTICFYISKCFLGKFGLLYGKHDLHIVYFYLLVLGGFISVLKLFAQVSKLFPAQTLPVGLQGESRATLPLSWLPVSEGTCTSVFDKCWTNLPAFFWWT